jgi:hypothetical protein
MPQENPLVVSFKAPLGPITAASGASIHCARRRGPDQRVEWAWPRQLLLDRRPVTRAQRLSTARAARSIGAVRIRREGREWLWMLPTAGGAAATVTATTGNGGDGDGQLLSQGG